MKKFLQWISDYRVILFLFILTAIVASSQSLLLGEKKYVSGGIYYNVYNNYTIFKSSFFHLVNDQDLYADYPMEHWDIYKYSPTFSLLFGVFALLPDVAGVTLWNLVNALILVFAIFYLPRLNMQQKGLILLVCVIESMTAMQNEQSNGLMAGLIILAFGLCERNKFFLAILCLVLTVYIKIFGLVAFSLLLFYPGKIRMGLYALFWFGLLFFLPLLVIDFQQLKFLYTSWGNMLSEDHSVSIGLSVLGWLESWFRFTPDKIWLALVGAILFLLPFLRTKVYSEYYFRLLALSSVLIWIVIFNHKAESPTFVIAMAGIGIWFFMQKPTLPNVILFSLAVLFTTISPTDIFPSGIRKQFVEPYVLKAVPCIFIWAKVIYDMMSDQIRVRLSF